MIDSEQSLQKLASDLEAAAQLLTEIKNNYPPDCKERRLLLLAKDASFFIFLKQTKEFSDFLRKMEDGLTDKQLEKLKCMGGGIE